MKMPLLGLELRLQSSSPYHLKQAHQKRYCGSSGESCYRAYALKIQLLLRRRHSSKSCRQLLRQNWKYLPSSGWMSFRRHQDDLTFCSLSPMTLSFPEFYLKSPVASVHFTTVAECASGLSILACQRVCFLAKVLITQVKSEPILPFKGVLKSPLTG